jgi:Xaa-Pro aminopeptidase
VQVNALLNQFNQEFYAAKATAQKALADLRKAGNYTQTDAEDKIRAALATAGIGDQAGLFEIMRSQLL